MKDFKMEAFVVFTREETTDPEELATYSAGVGPSFDGHDVTFLAAYGAMEHLEGPPLNDKGAIAGTGKTVRSDGLVGGAGHEVSVGELASYNL